MKFFIVCLFSLTSLFGADAAGGVQDAAGLWAQAVLKRDKTVLERVLADEFEFSGAGSLSNRSKADYIDAITDRSSSYEAFVLRDLLIRTHGNTAVLSGYVDEKPHGRESSTVRILQLYVENSGHWQLASSLSTRLLAPGSSRQSRTGNPVGAVRDTAVDWTRAVLRQDKSALEALTADGLNFALPDGRTTLSKTEYIAMATARQSAYDTFELTGDVTIQVHGRGAVLSGYVDTKPRGSEAAMMRFMQVYVENSGHWQLTSSTSTAVRARDRNRTTPALDAADQLEAVREAAVAWTRALVAKDDSTLRNLATDDLIFGHSGGRQPQNKQEFIAYAKNSDYEALPLRDISTRSYGQTALLSCFLDTKHSGRPTRPVKTLQVFRNIDNQWQLVAFQSARLNAPERGEGETEHGTSAEIKAVEEAAAGWTRAMVRKDRAELERLLAPDLVFVHSNGSTIQNQAQYLAASERATYEALPLSDIETNVYGETAVLTAHIDTKNVRRDPFRVRTMQIFVKNHGQWQLAGFQSTRLSSGSRVQ